MSLETPLPKIPHLRLSHRQSPVILRRAPIVGALCFIGAITALAKVPFLRSKFGHQSPVRAVHSSSAMEGSTATVPSIVVYVTVPNKEAGKKLSESIITEKLAVCVNRVPGVESVYWWDGKVQTDSEELLIIKTRESLLDALTEHVKRNHEYDVPEVISLPITGGNLKYLEWIKSSTKEN
ncbi:uncharacterized protein A4U43_C03F18900 [Asparagus officinalis]|uniref:Protein CutA, chloroplastic n=1 Tax=Asparagus officinalis TaxID=4686 RepID=A0A5P1FGD8_ASPOF|nr:protein CutA 1, chloroplastic [Asparagus officinalis]ONK75630.1 uncharacterized protein A4U43_C03F18900 [Asparagus officinalis]